MKNKSKKVWVWCDHKQTWESVAGNANSFLKYVRCPKCNRRLLPMVVKDPLSDSRAESLTLPPHKTFVRRV